MIICFFSDFCSSKHCKTVYERLCIAEKLPHYCKTLAEYIARTVVADGSNKPALYITTEDETEVKATHIILLNKAMPDSSFFVGVPKSRVLGLAFEPPPLLNPTQHWLEFVKKHVGIYLIGERGQAGYLLPEFTEHFGYLWHNPVKISSLPSSPRKTAIMSIMVSEKRNTVGHQLRHHLVNIILKTNLPIHIYGRGCRYYMDAKNGKRDPRIRGEFVEDEPYTNYLFHIAIENLQYPHYFSEKIINPLIVKTVPIYWGCTKIRDYFPDCGIIRFQTPEEGMDIIQQCCFSPQKYLHDIDVLKVHKKINLLENLPLYFNEDFRGNII
jgi:hypothetical protein